MSSHLTVLFAEIKLKTNILKNLDSWNDVPNCFYIHIRLLTFFSVIYVIDRSFYNRKNTETNVHSLILEP